MSEVKKLEIDGEVFEIQEYGYEAQLDIMEKAFDLETEVGEGNEKTPKVKTKMRPKEFQLYTVFYSLKSWIDKAGNEVPIAIENMKKLSKKAGAMLFTEATKLNGLEAPEEKNL